MIQRTTLALALLSVVALTDARGETPKPRASTYPAIGDMPRARDGPPMTEDDAAKLKKEMNEARDRVQRKSHAPTSKQQ
jgi:hypothetical protein